MKSNELLDSKEPLVGDPAPSNFSRSLFSLTRCSSKTAKLEELPKVVLGKPWNRLLTSCWIHLLPLAACIGLIWLDRKQYFWFEDERSTTMNSLQFAAKVLELLIMGSLSAMLLHHVRRHLTGADGIPFGLFSMSYRATDVLLVTESAFWLSLFNNGTWRLGLFAFFVALFSVLVGPSSAIALLPTPGWYSFPTAFSNATNRVLLLQNSGNWSTSVQNTMEMMYETNMTNQHFGARAGECESAEAFGMSNCPGRVSKDIEDWMGRGGENYTFVEAATLFSFPALSTIVNRTTTAPSDIAVATAPYENLIRSLGLIWEDINSGELNTLGPVTTAAKVRFSTSPSSKIYQPVVQAQCTWPDNPQNGNFMIAQLKADGIFSFDPLRGWKFDKDAQWQVPNTTISRVLDMKGSWVNSFRVEWIEAKDVNAVGRFSIGALVSIPPSISDSGEGDNPRRLIPCAFTAYWMPSTMVLDFQSRTVLNTNWTDSPNPMAAAVQSARNGNVKTQHLPAPLDLIKIDASWAKKLDVNLSNADAPYLPATMMDSLLQVIRSSTHLEYPDYDAPEPLIQDYISNITQGLTASVALGLANFGYRPGIWLQVRNANTFRSLLYITGRGIGTSESDGINDSIPQVADILISVYRYGFSYGARNTTTLYAFVIIYIYLGILVLYSAYALWDQLHRHPYPINSWGGIQDVVALALNSPRPEHGELENCGAGISTKEVWKRRVKVRANQEKRLEMVFAEREDLEPLMPGEMYT